MVFGFSATAVLGACAHQAAPFSGTPARYIVVADDANHEGFAYENAAKASASPNNMSPATTFPTQTKGTHPVAVAVDPAGKIYIASISSTPVQARISVYSDASSPKLAPENIIDISSVGSHDGGLAIGDGVLYKANSTFGFGSVLALNSRANHAYIDKVAMDHPTGIAMANAKVATGALYVSNSGITANQVLEFHPCPVAGDWSPTPFVTIEGHDTQLTNPVGIAVDDDGYVYVLNRATQPNEASIVVFDPSASGNAKPIASLVDHRISDPRGIAVDDAGRIYIADGKAGGQVLIYAQKQATDTPTFFASIAGAKTGLANPVGIAVR